MATTVAYVVLRFAKIFRQAYTTHKEHLRVSLTSFYNKINGTELPISESLLAFNIRQVIFAALCAEHNGTLVNEVNHHAISVEVSRLSDGMLAVLDDSFWKRFLGETVEDLATPLRELSRQLDIKRYLKCHRGPKKKN